MKHVPDFVKGATNVYRTRDFIVKQVIGIKIDCEENNAVVSHDTFYRAPRSVTPNTKFCFVIGNALTVSGCRPLCTRERT